MVTDPLSDLLIRIKNGYRAGLTTLRMPYSRTKEAVAQVLVTEGYLASAKKEDTELVIELKYQGKEPALIDLRRVSKPGQRIYSPVKQLPKVWGGLGINILSTPKGVVSDKVARKLNVGGEIIAQIW